MEIEKYLEYILKSKKYIYGISEDVNYYKEKVKCSWKKEGYYEYPVIELNNRQTICTCEGKITISNGDTCKICKKKSTSLKENFIIKKSDFKNINSFIVKENLPKQDDATDNFSLDTFFFIIPYKEFGIKIFKINAKVKKSENLLENNINFIIDREITIIPGEEVSAKKVNKEKKEDIEIIEAMQISTNIFESDMSVLFFNADSMIDFLLKNKEFAKRTGLLDYIKLINIPLTQNSFFMFYLFLYSQYPVVEFLIKMGHTSLITNLILDVINKKNKNELKLEVEKLNKLFNNTTKGSLALTIPSYIADFLKMKNANYKEYLMWSDISELEDLSKENFESFINSREYLELSFNNQLYLSINLLKYGYTIEKVSKYVLKQSIQENTKLEDCFILLKDYLTMCDVMQINMDLFPSNLKSTHDNVVKIYEEKQNEEKDKIMKKIKEKYSIYIPRQYQNKKDTHIIIIPENLKELADEGEQQHNCVGSYYNDICKGKSIIFFIRDKNHPKESLATCEYKDEKLFQIKAKNNTEVTDQKILDFAKKFCSQIKNKERN